MRTMPLIWASQRLLLCGLVSIASTGSAQNSLLPSVTIRATTPIASRSPVTSGVFTVYRSGNPTNELHVYYSVSGTASNGVDYSHIGPWVVIPGGALTSTITVQPINNGQTDAVQTVVVELTPSPLLPPVNYEIGYPSNDTVYIEGNGTTNLPPLVSLVNPTNGEVFHAPADILLVAYARDLDGSVESVEFFSGNHSLGIVSNGVVVDPLPGHVPPPGTRAFLFDWTNVPAVGYVLTAKATDNGGATSVSDPVSITVLPGPPPTNQPPVVRITNPPDRATFRAPVNIPIFAYAFDPDGYVASVQFFAGATDLGFGQRLPISVNSSGVPSATASNTWFLRWSNAPPGAYALTALATDNGGLSSTSAPVNITVLPPLPPPTNRPPVVSIVATEPIAIEGTNCWPWLGLTNPTPSWSNWVATSPSCRFFTNCGPRNALFTIRRFGNTNSDLTVTYDIGGTATNGVDYLPLSGIATIPAGQRAVLLPLVPLDDGPPDITSTVILTLTPATNSPADYLLGFPQRAAALILDGRPPRAVSAVLRDKCFHLSATGPDGAWFHIEYTTDLLHWTPVCTNQVIDGSIDFVDPDAPNDAARFYRAVPELSAPQ